MGMILQKQYTMPAPPGAEIIDIDGQRIARWRLRSGKTRTAEVVDCQDGKLRVRGKSKFYTARFRDGAGNVIEVPTGCRDEVAARSVLTQLERKAELVRAGVMTASEVDAADHATVPLKRHFDAYERHLQAKGSDPRRISMLRKRLERLARECGFSRLNKMAAGPVENWLVEHAATLSAATRNNYRESLVCFGNWCRRTRRLMTNPFVDLPRADQKADRRHHRRALNQIELLNLLKVAELRPLAEYGREVVRKKPSSKRSARSRATWTRKSLVLEGLDAAVARARIALKDNPELIAELERTGHERKLLYKMLFLTGLRKGEAASLTVSQLEIDGSVAYVVLNAADEKNRQGSSIPLRSDLVADLRTWIAQHLESLQAEACGNGCPIPARLDPKTPLFRVPSGLSRILDRDLGAAGIPKRDERGRVVDVHALRVTFGTHLCAAGVPLRTAQAAMRHSKPELTANIYTDPKLLDVAGAINALPSLATPNATGTPRLAQG